MLRAFIPRGGSLPSTSQRLLSTSTMQTPSVLVPTLREKTCKSLAPIMPKPLSLMTMQDVNRVEVPKKLVEMGSPIPMLHASGVDMTQPANIRVVNAGTPVQSYSVDDQPSGSWVAPHDPNSRPTESGILPVGQVVVNEQGPQVAGDGFVMTGESESVKIQKKRKFIGTMKQDTPVLSSVSAPVTDSWSLDKFDLTSGEQQTSGGRAQYYSAGLAAQIEWELQNEGRKTPRD